MAVTGAQERLSAGGGGLYVNSVLVGSGGGGVGLRGMRQVERKEGRCAGGRGGRSKQDGS